MTQLPTPQGTSELRTPRPTKPFTPPRQIRADVSDRQPGQENDQATSSDLTEQDVPTVIAKKSSRLESPRPRGDALAHFIYSNADTATSDRNRLFFVSCAVIILIIAVFVFSQLSTKSKEQISQTPGSPSVSKEPAKTNPPPSEKAGQNQDHRAKSAPAKTSGKAQASSRTNRKLRVSPRR
jgi:hypothetical protein